MLAARSGQMVAIEWLLTELIAHIGPLEARRVAGDAYYSASEAPSSSSMLLTMLQTHACWMRRQLS